MWQIMIRMINIIYIPHVIQCNFASELGIAFDGGKDSLSMYCKEGDNIVKSPPFSCFRL